MDAPFGDDKEDLIIDKKSGSYYSAFTLPVQSKECYFIQPRCSQWTIQVGQTIAVSCNESTIPFMDHQKKKKRWYPFRIPWAPAQVLALYRTPSSGQFKIKLRWLYWHDDVVDSLKEGIPRMPNQVFEHYSIQTCDATVALGRIYLDSSDSSSSHDNILGKDGMPRLFLTCQHGIIKSGKKEALESVTDWKGRTGGVPATALKRGLSLLTTERKFLIPETMDAMKSKVTVNGGEPSVKGVNEEIDDETCETVNDTEEESGSGASPQQDASSNDSVGVFTQEEDQEEQPKTPRSIVSDTTADSSSVSCEGLEPFYNHDGVSYYWKLQVPAREKDYQVQSDMDQRWTIQVGDLVAIQHDGSSEPSKKRPWFPFKTPWSPAQVLALRHDVDDGYQVEVRWLYRYGDFEGLDKAYDVVKKHLKNNQKGKLASKIVYEYASWGIESADSVLGRVVLSSNNRNPSQKFLNSVQGEDGIPQAPLICRSMISERYDVVTPVNDWEINHASNLQQLQRAAANGCFSDCGLQDATLEKLEGSAVDADEGAPSPSASSSSSIQSDGVVSMELDNGSGTSVEQSESSTSDSGSGTSVGQDESASDKSRPKSRPCLDANRPIDAKGVSSPLESRSPSVQSEDVMPMEVDDESGVSADEEETSTSTTNLRGNNRPTTRSRAMKRLAPQAAGRPRKSPRGHSASKAHREVLDNALVSFVKEDGKTPTKSHPVASPASVHDSSVASSVSLGMDDDERIFLPKGRRPFHQDFTALRSYYTEIQVVPPQKCVSVSREFVPTNEPCWTVKMGDAVAVHYEKGAGKTNFGSASDGNNSTNHPYNVAWAVAEVVAIWKEHESKDDMKKTKRKSNLGAQDGIVLEIRWFYRKSELPGAMKTTSAENAAKYVEYEEVFETDLMDECKAESLLGPMKLRESATRLGLSEWQHGMPVIDVLCRRFWSIHRKSLMPCGSMAGRAKRGRMHSKYFGKGGVLNAVWREFDCKGTEEPDRAEPVYKPNNWERAFKGVIEKLGLSSASEDASTRGIPLTGREAEQEKIMTFLRSRICGTVDDDADSVDDDDSVDSDDSDDDDSNVATSASLFVAGPPGTGKTASVHSVIARLRQEQAKGKLPAFEFVSLNGMEMRHPFEAYVKFWEVMSGPQKQKCSPEIAVAKLERHFAGRGRDEDGKSSQIVVLLLDEIDYLVTKKQTVLYNFFDWPRRTCENGSGPKLIVVGISNTLNLPSRLKPSVQSRLGSETCGYKSYNVKDMVAILKTKIQPEKAVSRTA